mmetsp:Transcript_42132/g.119572  ORF Transcript_42132/g.119572 Transcript_42132/m.119572 type:complete len:170 (+) Transcript_42132:223-732(+)
MCQFLFETTGVDSAPDENNSGQDGEEESPDEELEIEELEMQLLQLYQQNRSTWPQSMRLPAGATSMERQVQQGRFVCCARCGEAGAHGVELGTWDEQNCPARLCSRCKDYIRSEHTDTVQHPAKLARNEWPDQGVLVTCIDCGNLGHLNCRQTPQQDSLTAPRCCNCGA